MFGQKVAHKKVFVRLILAVSIGVPCWLAAPTLAQVDTDAIPPEVILSSPNNSPPAPTNTQTTQTAPAGSGRLQQNGQMNTIPPELTGGRPSRVNWTAPGQVPTAPGQAPPQGSSALLQGGQMGSQMGGAHLTGMQGGQPGGSFGPNMNDDCPTCPKKKGFKQHYYPNDAPPQQQAPPAFNSAPLSAVTPGQVRQDPLAVIETTRGTIKIRLFRQHAPKTVANFIDIASSGFYNSLLFHRVEPGFVVQAGCPNGNGTGGYTDPHTGQERRLGLELNPRLRHNAPGVVAMARTGNDPHSASSQFYITLSPQDRLDNKYAVFGGVIQGMDVVQRLTTQDRIINVSVQEQE